MDKNPDVADDEEGDNSNGNMTIQSSKAIEGIDKVANHQKGIKIIYGKYNHQQSLGAGISFAMDHWRQ